MVAFSPSPRAFLTIAVTLVFAGTGYSGEIHDLLRKGDVRKARELLAKNPELKNTNDDLQQTPLHVAARHGQVEIVKLLLEQGAEVDARTYNQFTPLHLTQSPEVVKLLVSHKADLEARSVGETALQRAAAGQAQADKAAARKWEAITRMLLGSGAKYDIAFSDVPRRCGARQSHLEGRSEGSNE